MKIKDGYMLRNIGGDFVVLPLDAGIEFNKMMTLNETGKVLWEALEKETDVEALTKALTDEYDVTAEKAKQSVENFIARLKELDLLD